MHLAAFDPGESTGYALLEMHPMRFRGKDITQYTLRWDVVASKDIANKVPWDCLHVCTPVIYEEAVITSPWVKRVVFEVIGAIKGFALEHNFTLIAQRPDVGKFVKARFFDGKEPKIVVHAREAIYHIIIYLYRNGHREDAERLVQACQEYTSPTGKRSNAVDASGIITFESI